MAQHDYDIANQTGASFRTDLNNCLNAIRTVNSGSSAPSPTVAYLLWANTTANELQMRNGENNGWQGLFTFNGNINRQIGIGTDTPSTYDAAARNLVINQSSGDGGLTIHTGTSATGNIYFADASSGNASSEGRVSYDHSQNELSLSTSRLRRGLFGTSGSFFNMALTNVLTGQSSASAGTTFTLFQGTHSATEGVRSTGTASVQIYTNGNIQNTNNSYGQLSDIKLKESISDAGSQWDDIKAIEIKNFHFIGDATRQLGVIAQQVETVSPGLIYETADQEQGQLTGTTTKAVKYSVLYMKAVKALQEAMERIETLEAKMVALEEVEGG
jgi:hypothetical protein